MVKNVWKLFYSGDYFLPLATVVTRKPKKEHFRTTDNAQTNPSHVEYIWRENSSTASRLDSYDKI
jgi:hypothetical protein